MKRPDVISHLEVPLKPRHVFIKGSLGSETLRGGGPITRYRMTSPSTDSKDMLTTQKRAARTTHLGYRCQMCITTPQGKASRKYMANLYFNRQIKKRHIYIERQADRQADRDTCRQTDRQIETHAGRQTGR